MSDPESQAARQVHELLLLARPERNDPNVIKAALFQSSIPTSSSPLKEPTFAAIKNLQTAVEKGASAEEGEKLLLEAIHMAEQWAVNSGRSTCHVVSGS
jgi:hypothetical protein